jgi:hypothetical protein
VCFSSSNAVGPALPSCSSPSISLPYLYMASLHVRLRQLLLPYQFYSSSTAYCCWCLSSTCCSC